MSKNLSIRAREKAKAIADYFDRTKGVGHTKAMLNGLRATDRVKKVVCLVLDEQHANFIRSKVPESDPNDLLLVTPTQASLAKLDGVKAPMVADNYTLSVLFREMEMMLAFEQKRADDAERKLEAIHRLSATV